MCKSVPLSISFMIIPGRQKRTVPHHFLIDRKQQQQQFFQVSLECVPDFHLRGYNTFRNSRVFFFLLFNSSEKGIVKTIQQWICLFAQRQRDIKKNIKDLKVWTAVEVWCYKGGAVNNWSSQRQFISNAAKTWKIVNLSIVLTNNEIKKDKTQEAYVSKAST